MPLPVKLAALSKLRVPSSVDNLVGKILPGAKGPSGPAAPPAASPTGLATRSSSSNGAPPPRAAKPQWAVLGESNDPVKRDATIIAAHIKSRENIKQHGPLPFKDGVGNGGGPVTAQGTNSPASPASSTSSAPSIFSAKSGSSEPPTPATPTSPALSGTTLQGASSSSTSAKPASGGQPPVDGDAGSTVMGDPAGDKSSGSGSKLGAKLRAAAAAVTGKAAGAGGTAAPATTALGNIAPSGATAVGNALNPVHNSPTANAAGNLVGTALPSLSNGLQHLDSKAQTNKMEDIGTDMPDKTKTASMNLAHNSNEDAINQTRMAGDNLLFGNAQNNSINLMKSVKENAGLMAATVKGNAEVAKNGAQTLGS